MSTKTQIVEEYLAKIHSGDIDSWLASLTDDFAYRIEGPVKPSNVDYTDSGLDKDKYKSLFAGIGERYQNINSTIVSITEEEDRVHVKGITKFQVNVPESLGKSTQTTTSELPFTAECLFSGDKICSINYTTPPDAQQVE